MLNDSQDSMEKNRDDPIPEGLKLGARFTGYLLVIVAGITVAGFLALQMAEIVIPFLAGLILSALLVPLSSFLQRHRWPKWLAVVTVWVVVLGLLAGLVLLITFQIRSEIPAIQKQVATSLDAAKQFLATQPFGLTEAKLNDLVTSSGQWLQDNAAGLGSGAAEVGTTAAHIVEGVIIVLFVTLFALIDGKGIWTWAVQIWPRKSHQRIIAAGDAGWKTLSSFIRIQLVVAATDAVGIGLGALILGVPLAVPIATVVFLGAFVPFVGAIIGGAFAVGLSLMFNGWIHAVIMLGIVILVQQIESHVLQPWLTGSRVKIHPLAVILGVTAGAALAGITGAFFAVPVIATLNSMFRAAKNPPTDQSAASAHHTISDAEMTNDSAGNDLEPNEDR
ncbi:MULTISPECIES: AI-2E family transporter [unclassified Brevibacterium]|uniref:AI-2E family transporter n=1 Tax=unclassified Brevibacterium TaxID=2614124 RepID=UPI000C5795C9|nr:MULTISPECIES: AI-2E family transporter [unclassified Brevibacterium]SMX91860.1 Predicted PurR-regulated permease PerM [Brevibacterium sp. 239c]